MIRKAKNYIFASIAALTLLAPGLVPALASVAVADNITDQICSGSTSATSNDTTDSGSAGDSSCSTSTNSGTSAIKKLASQIVNIFSVIVGVAAVIMIIVGGFRYITSGGDSSNVSGAKNTLIYAVVGLVIVALAQFIVRYVLSTTAGTGLNNS
jgi:hypothetical protein